MSNPYNSEVARFREQIELESRAIEQAVSGIAMTARHDIISRRYQAISQYHHQLIDLIGQEQATDIVCEAYYRGQQLEDNSEGGAA